MKLSKMMAAALAIAVISCAGVSWSAGMDGQQQQPQQITQDQVNQVYQYISSQYPGIIAAGQALTAKYNELNAILAQPTPDKARIEALAREIGELRGKLLAARADIQAQLRKQGLPPDFYDFVTNPDGSISPIQQNAGQGRRGFHKRHGHGGFHGGQAFNSPCPWVNGMTGAQGYGAAGPCPYFNGMMMGGQGFGPVAPCPYINGMMGNAPLPR